MFLEKSALVAPQVHIVARPYPPRQANQRGQYSSPGAAVISTGPVPSLRGKIQGTPVCRLWANARSASNTGPVTGTVRLVLFFVRNKCILPLSRSICS